MVGIKNRLGLKEIFIKLMSYGHENESRFIWLFVVERRDKINEYRQMFCFFPQFLSRCSSLNHKDGKKGVEFLRVGLVDHAVVF